MAIDLADILSGKADAGELSRESLMLIAMLCDQVQTLGLLYRRGAWRRDPSEVAAWLRLSQEEGGLPTRETRLRDVFLLELQMWGRSTDVLLEVLDRDAGVWMTRRRIIALAMAAGTRNRAVSDLDYREKLAVRRGSGRRRVQVQRAARVDLEGRVERG